MSWRTVVITSRCKLSYKNNYLIVRNENNNMIHLSEIGIVIVDSTMVSVTSFLLAELVKRKIKIIFCDENRNPISELMPLYGCHNTSKRVINQVDWDIEIKNLVWAQIIRSKILNQANILDMFNLEGAEQLYEYVKQVEPGDLTNREGVAARVYFSKLFGDRFIRHSRDDVNAALDYGYSILASAINKEISSNGCITQLGIKHINEFNPFNLTYDIIEPFRPVIDLIVFENLDLEFDKHYKYKLIKALESKVYMEERTYYLTNAIQSYVKKVLNALDSSEPGLVPLIHIYEL